MNSVTSERANERATSTTNSVTSELAIKRVILTLNSANFCTYQPTIYINIGFSKF